MDYTKKAADKRCDEIYAFITGYISQYGHSPAFREIGEAVGLRSSATISRYIHRLIDDGRISIEESKPRTLSAKNSEAAFETVHQRVCLTLADGGKIYMDCNLRKPRAASIKLTFDGILDAKAMKGRIERIVSCNTSYE